mgnify:CR=1 FL=1
MGKNKSKNYTKQKLSSFAKTGRFSKDILDDLSDDFNEERYEANKHRKLHS